MATLFYYRRKCANEPITFRTPGYPLLPLIFMGTIGLVVVQSLRTSLVNTGIGVAIMVAGIPVYFIWKHLFRPVRP